MTTAPLALTVQKLNPCLMELCRFFQQCLCTSQKREPRTNPKMGSMDAYEQVQKGPWKLQGVTELGVMKLKDAYSLEGKL